ncbi:aspartate/glutamate racemase family protein [Pantoea sp. At-9b]|jgi:allantoin racemase|uniref:aspartate/glutamate racemase family protein n=1 Tax=Pantoea sp. (strain At-9b) TaxID=592316 RepID=UPI0001B3F8E3|nr:aspartate/glutamate racemase family protein [Pantoea sp. At-9b]ADU72913.1 putative hydantoin racemase HyuA [Pantoea sp. At-9b]
MRKRLYVINASSRRDTGITENIAASLSWMQFPAAPEIVCVTLADGPCGIVSARDSDDAAPAVLRFIEQKAQQPDSAGFVVACFSDPGVHAARELTSKPVVGIGEAGLSAALSLGDVIGSLGVSAGRGSKVWRLARTMGVHHRLIGHQGLGLDYAELQQPAQVEQRLIAAAQQLKAAGAEALLFAGAGLARYVSALEQAVELPVVDPTQAAAGLVLAQIMQSNGGRG